MNSFIFTLIYETGIIGPSLRGNWSWGKVRRQLRAPPWVSGEARSCPECLWDRMEETGTCFYLLCRCPAPLTSFLGVGQVWFMVLRRTGDGSTCALTLTTSSSSMCPKELVIIFPLITEVKSEIDPLPCSHLGSQLSVASRWEPSGSRQEAQWTRRNSRQTRPVSKFHITIFPIPQALFLKQKVEFVLILLCYLSCLQFLI